MFLFVLQTNILCITHTHRKSNNPCIFNNSYRCIPSIRAAICFASPVCVCDTLTDLQITFLFDLLAFYGPIPYELMSHKKEFSILFAVSSFPLLVILTRDTFARPAERKWISDTHKQNVHVVFFSIAETMQLSVYFDMHYILWVWFYQFLLVCNE